MGFAGLATANFAAHNDQTTLSSTTHELWVTAFCPSPRLEKNHAIIRCCPLPRSPIPPHRTDQGGVDGKLGAP